MTRIPPAPPVRRQPERCPNCHGARRPRHYLCLGCWDGLTPAARAALRRRDARAAARLMELHRQLAAGVPLHKIQMSP